jgi:mycofactocin biosynthetic radical S-adenosylmethionine protein MftC
VNAMYHGRIHEKIAEQHILHSVMLELTYRCNLDCFYCYNDKAAKGTPLSFEQYLALFADLARMQTLFLTFTGGEPMVHPRFFDLGKAARDAGFAVRVRTNGHTLTEKVARRLLQDVDPYLVEMSIHGATAESHDKQTRVKGSFNQLVSNIRAMTQLGLIQQLVCTPTAWNEHEIPELFQLADELGIRLRFQGPVGPRDNGDTEPLSIQPSAGVWNSIYASQSGELSAVDLAANSDLIATSGAIESPERVCGVGTTGVDIDPFGNVYPCIHLKRSAGSLHEQSIEKIWYGGSGRQVLADAEQLSLDAAKRFIGTPVTQYGAPLFCPAVEINANKGCAGSCGSG